MKQMRRAHQLTQAVEIKNPNELRSRKREERAKIEQDKAAMEQGML